MRKLLAALAGLLGIAWLRSRSAQPPTGLQADHAAELRAKLAERKAAEEEPPEVPPEPEPEGDVESRRRAVYERARAQIDELDGD